MSVNRCVCLPVCLSFYTLAAVCLPSPESETLLSLDGSHSLLWVALQAACASKPASAAAIDCAVCGLRWGRRQGDCLAACCWLRLGGWQPDCDWLELLLHMLAEPIQRLPALLWCRVHPATTLAPELPELFFHSVQDMEATGPAIALADWQLGWGKAILAAWNFQVAETG